MQQKSGQLFSCVESDNGNDMGVNCSSIYAKIEQREITNKESQDLGGGDRISMVF